MPPEQFIYLIDEVGDLDDRVLTLREWRHVANGWKSMDEPVYTSGGFELTEERMQELADEAEAGYDVELLRPRPVLRRGLDGAGPDE